MIASPERAARAAKSRRSRFIAIVAFGGGWMVAFLVVRLGLDWSDSQPYEGVVTEQRYLVIAAIAVLIALAATAGGLILWVRARRTTHDETGA